MFSENAVLSRFTVMLVAVSLATAQPPEPPSIVNGPSASTTYFSGSGEALIIPCQVYGVPPPIVEWWKNGVKSSSLTPQQDGSVRLDVSTGSSIEGYYQCHASSGIGTALSNVTRVLQARQAYFQTNNVVPQVKSYLGRPLTLKCQPTTPSVPQARALYNSMEYEWRDEKQDSNDVKFPLGRRAQIDENGNLNIASVTADDASIWSCYVHNRILQVYAGGSKQEILAPVAPTDAAPQLAIMFYTNYTLNPSKQNSVITALEGRTTSLRCFFSGSDNVYIDWMRTDNIPLPTDGRVSKLNLNIELYFQTVKKSDEATYICTGSAIGFSSVQFPFQLYVRAAPTFKTIFDQPHDMDVTVGDDVIIRCNAYADPVASVVWYKNGEQMTTTSNDKYQWSSDLTALTIRNVCKNKCSGSTDNDIDVYQCNASNIYGYAFGNGYVNVFERTVFNQTQSDLEPSLPKPVTFTNVATSDPVTPVTYIWTRKTKDCPNWCTISNNTDKFQFNGGSLTITNTEESDLGTYRCNASNGISSVYHDTKFDRPPPPAAALVWEYWWIPFIVILIFVIVLLIILIVCCCLYRNRGDEYPVDEKEREADRNPEKELADSGFHDYQRPAAGRHYYEDERRPLTNEK